MIEEITSFISTIAMNEQTKMVALGVLIIIGFPLGVLCGFKIGAYSVLEKQEKEAEGKRMDDNREKADKLLNDFKANM